MSAAINHDAGTAVSRCRRGDAHSRTSPLSGRGTAPHLVVLPADTGTLNASFVFTSRTVGEGAVEERPKACYDDAGGFFGALCLPGVVVCAYCFRGRPVHRRLRCPEASCCGQTNDRDDIWRKRLAPRGEDNEGNNAPNGGNERWRRLKRFLMKMAMASLCRGKG